MSPGGASLSLREPTGHLSLGGEANGVKVWSVLADSVTDVY